MSEREDANVHDETDAEVARLTEQLANFQAVVRAREERVSLLTDRLRERKLAVPDEITDTERGRAFLERLRERRFGDDSDRAAIAINNVLHHGYSPDGMAGEDLAALGRVLRGSA